jgi:hypothetical protein
MHTRLPRIPWSRHRNHPRWSTPLRLLVLVLGLLSASLYAQTTAQLSGTVQDNSGAIIPGASITLINQGNQLQQQSHTNDHGLFTFPSLTPGSYTVKVEQKGFTSQQLTDIVLHAGDDKSIPPVSLSVGSETTTVNVEEAADFIPTDNGARTEVLDERQIENLALPGRDVTELLKVLPGATTQSSGLTQNAPAYSSLNTNVQQSAIGNGININGAVNRGGTALLADGANVIDPGNMASSVSVINPEMTDEVSVQASNFGADTPFGPVVVSTISKSGTDKIHGEAYIVLRNSALNANDWYDNHNHISQGSQHYYYPGGNVGGPVPFTHHKLFYWAGFEKWLQDQGNGNLLQSYIPTPEMMAGDFIMDNADNQKLCPQGFFASPTSGYPQGGWCNDLGSTIYPDGSTAATSKTLPSYGSNGGNFGQKIPSQFIDPGALALAKIWPAANVDPSSNASGYNYIQPIDNVNNGWIYRFRIDYQFSDRDRIYGSFQHAYDSELAQGNGAHLYWTPGNAIPFPGGGVNESFVGKSLAGHFVHTFSASATNDLMASWAYGSFPFVVPNPSAGSRATLGYTYGKVFSTPSVNIPAYSSAGGQSFPDFSQASIFENPPGKYAVKKESPQFSDTFTKVWGAHTVKAGAYTQNTDNFQSTFSTYQDGNITFGGGNPDIITGINQGSGNPVANFLMGIASGYSENNSSPIADTAYMSTAVFAQDDWKATKRLTLNYGARIEHIGHWYDRDRVGMAVFYPDRVLSDYNSGKYAPGFYWHAIDEGVPLSGQPNRFAFFDPRFGLSYDVFGNGKLLMRGGWGLYRFVTQVNDVAAPLVTAQHVLGYNLPGGHTVRLPEISKLAAGTCTAQCASGSSQTGFDPGDYSQPTTRAYNFSVDFRTKFNTLIDVAYVGSSTDGLSDNSEGIEGSNYSALADMNKTPVGALFKPDPRTGILSTNPENVGCNPNFNATTCTKTGNSYADYHPYGLEYGTNSIYVDQGIGYTNYNGLQIAAVKNTGRLGYNFNFTWSKTLGTGLQTDPFNIRNDYGPVATDRPYVFNASYYYQSGKVHLGNGFLNVLASDWTITGITTWQAGGYIPSALGNGVPNFSLGAGYDNTTGPFSIPATNPNGTPTTVAALQGIGTGLSSKSFAGTDASVPILPNLTCNPGSGLAANQKVNGACFALPQLGTNGSPHYPYLSAPSYYDNDLALYRGFRVPGREGQQIQFRIEAFNWLNHPLPDFAGSALNLGFKVDYNSKASVTNFNVPAFGVLNSKTGSPYERILELQAKYFF